MQFDINTIRTEIQNKKYENIGNGSGRSVYDIGDGFVAKFARNIKGVAQNYTEYEIYTRSSASILAKVYKISGDRNILIMQKAKPIDDINVLFEHFHVKSKEALAYVDIIRYLQYKYGLMPADMCKPGSWGIVDDKILLIDYGFTKWVSKKFYSR